VLEDVGDVGSFFQSLDESAGAVSCALVEVQARDRFEEAVVELRDFGRSDGFEIAESDVAGDDRGEAPVVGASQGSDSGDFELIRVVLRRIGRLLGGFDGGVGGHRILIITLSGRIWEGGGRHTPEFKLSLA